MVSVGLFSASDPTGHYSIEPIDHDGSVPTTEEDWSFGIIGHLRLLIDAGGDLAARQWCWSLLRSVIPHL